MKSSKPKNVLGPHLRQLREQRSWTPADVAERYAKTGFKCSEERIIRIENQELSIKDHEVLIFERIFGSFEIARFFAEELETRFGKKETWQPL